MTMNLLKHLASIRLPKSMTLPDEIDKVRILRAAELVIAFVPAPSNPLTFSEPGGAAQVLTITKKGREELLRSQDPGEQPPEVVRLRKAQSIECMSYDRIRPTLRSPSPPRRS